MPVILTIYHLAQTVVAGYAAMLSYTSIQKVRTYEKLTEKAAQYSNIAEDHLQTTRTTQGAGALSVFSSLVSSVYLLFSSSSSSSSSSPESSMRVPVLISTALAIGLGVAHRHINSYWRRKTKVPLPGSGDYNDAITTSNQMRQLVGGLAVSWGILSAWYYSNQLF